MLNPTAYLIRGRRVGLAAPSVADGDEYLALRRASAGLHGPWEPAPAPGSDPFGPEAYAGYLARSHREDADCLLVRRLEDGRLLGACNLSNIVRGAFLSAHMGYWAGAPFAGQGYLGEGVALAIERAFEVLQLHRIEANIQPTNAPSLALARRLGFRREGYSPRYLRIAGDWTDHERWALLVEDWRAARDGGRAD